MDNQNPQQNQQIIISRDTVFDGIRKNWTIIFFIGSLIVAWSTQQNKMNVIEKENDNNKLSIKDLQTQVNKIDNQTGGAIIEIKANYIFIKEKLEALEKNNTK